MKKLKIKSAIKNDGFTVNVADREFQQKYPLKIWHNFPRKLKVLLAQSAAVFFTNHLAITQNCHLVYDFPPPPTYSLFFHGLIYSLLEVSQYVKNPLVSLKKALEANLDVTFSGIPPLLSKSNITNTDSKNRAIIFFTFGKDSLLTFALASELGLNPELFFIDEPLSPYEYSGRIKIRSNFERAFGRKINYIGLNLGKLRQEGKEMWGWDMIILQYLLILTPYILHTNADYILLANEYNNDEININSNLMRIFYRFEQNSQWTLNSNNLLRLFSSKAVCTSFIEPLFEYMTTYILHHRYPRLSEYHLSCGAEDPTDKQNRWCYLCSACARMFIFLKSLSFDPGRIGLKEDMLDIGKKKYFDIFDAPDEKKSMRKDFLDSHCELLFAFYLAAVRGIKGDLIDLFNRQYKKIVEKNSLYLLNRITHIYPVSSVPANYQRPLLKLFGREISQFKKEVKQVFAARA